MEKIFESGWKDRALVSVRINDEAIVFSRSHMHLYKDGEVPVKDIEFYEIPTEMFAENLGVHNWMDQLRGKSWFTEEMGEFILDYFSSHRKN